MTADERYGGVTVVGLDADDTLWHSENRFVEAHERFRSLIARFTDIDDAALDARMLATEERNLRLFGYGAKGFTLSLIETAIEVTDGRVDAAAIGDIVAFGKDLLDHPVELLAGVAETVDTLRDRGMRLLILTKGDLWHQESKVAASGLADRVDGVEIMSAKDEPTYRRVLDRHGVDPATFCMVGNSVRSDVLPVLGIGGRAVHVPYEFLWAHEAVPDADDDDRFATVAGIGEIPPLLGHT